MRRSLIVLFLFAFSGFNSHAQTQCGYVFDYATGEYLVGVNIKHLSSGKGVYTDDRGFFCVSWHDESFWVVSRVGYRNDTLNLAAFEDAQMQIFLMPAVYELQEVEVVQSFALRNFSRGLTLLTPSEISGIPAMGGERDLLKAVTTLPGINLGTEGFSSITVRGGGTEHNLFVLDGIPVYNSGHLFNFISVFNPEAVKDVSVYKHAFPARYGGGLASVVDVSMRDGNFKETKISADLGIINSKFTLEGPLGADGKTSYMLATRSTYLDLFKYRRLKRIRQKPIGVMPTSLLDKGDSEFGYTFADVNFKINHRFNQRHRFFASFYSGIDYYQLEDVSFSSRSSANFLRSNYLASLKSYHMLSNSLMMEFLVYANHHGNTRRTYDENYRYEWQWDQEMQMNYPRFYLTYLSENENESSLTNLAVEGHLSYAMSSEGMVRGGLSIMQHHYNPTDYFRKSLGVDGQTLQTSLKNFKPRAMQLAAYAGMEQPIYDKLDFSASMRFSGFLSDSVRYFRPEPRFTLGYKISPKDALSLSYSVMQQYNHAITRNEQMFNNTIWVPSTPQIKPQRSEQLSLGYLRLLGEADYQLETYFYYKRMNDLVFFASSPENQFLYHNWQNYLLGGGKGKGLGWEVSLTKQKGRVNGNVNYAFSRHFRQFSEVNRGLWFPYKFNRDHVFNLSGGVRLNQNWNIGFFWTLNSGARISLPNGFVQTNPFGWGYFAYDGVNNANLPTYHRLDVSFDWTRVLKNGQEIGISLNVYNAYYKKNSAYVFVGSKPIYDNDGNETDRVSVIKSVSIMPLIPALNISYKIK